MYFLLYLIFSRGSFAVSALSSMIGTYRFICVSMVAGAHQIDIVLFSLAACDVD